MIGIAVNICAFILDDLAQVQQRRCLFIEMYNFPYSSPPNH
jgi:hypothetical protein